MSDGDKKVVPRKKNTTEKREPKKLEAECILKSEKGAEYLVESKLGQGGFGEVWQVCLLKEPQKRFAMKTESNFAEPGKKCNLRLKIEVNLFEEIQKASNRIDKNHFVKMHDKGKTIDFKYYVMDLIWMSLKDAKRMCGDDFKPHTKIQIARQTLKGIESLHELGFLHRDIKPANFAVGLPPKDTIIYILDFGICRSFQDKDGGIRNARKTVKFMGTPMFASTEAHCLKEQARRDDLECWLYMLLDIYDKYNLPWWGLDPDEIQKHIDFRMELLQTSRDLHAAGKLKVPEKWCDIIDLLNGMAFEEAGDFVQINLILSQICVDENIDQSLPLDWFGKKEKSPEKAKKERKPSEKKKEARKKKTAEKPEVVEKKEPDAKKRHKQGTAGVDSGSGEETEEEESVDYEAYLRWKKRRSSRMKGSRNKHNSNSDRDRAPPKPRKKPSKVKKGGSEADKNVNIPEGKAHQEAKREDDKKAAIPENRPVEVKVDKIFDVKKKMPEEDLKKNGIILRRDGTPESNESNQERKDEKEKKKRSRKKTKSCQSMDEIEDKIVKIDDQKKKAGIRKKETNKKKADGKKKDEKIVEIPVLKMPPTPEPKKGPEVAALRK